ncbi:MAG TPA: peptidylprolyl isomerase [Rhizomicrobium sp.]
MRIATTLLLGAAALVCAGSPLLAQDGNRSRPAPAVATQPAEEPQDTAAPPTTDSVAAPTADAPAATAAAAPSPAPVQEAKNNDAAPVPKADAANAPDPDDADSIAATVNDESISDYEVRQRMALFLSTSNIPANQLNADQKKRIRGQILDRLEDEKVQLQEAVKKKITVSPVEVDKWINNMLSGNHITIQQLRTSLATAGASEDALRSQVTASIAWQKAVNDEYGDRVNVTPDMVSAELARYAEGAGKPHYRLVEIFLPVENPEQDAKVKKDADEIETQLHQGASFPMVARQFSQHPTAASGGDMGWVVDGQLAPELNAAAAKMEPGAISEPIRSTGGYYIIGLSARQEGLGTKIAEVPSGPTGPAGTLPLARLLFPISAKAPKEELEQVMKVAQQIQTHYESCGHLDELHQKMNGTVYMNLGDAKLADLSPQIQEAMKDTKPGEAAAPFMSEAGVELIARCDKRVVQQTAYAMPTKSEIEDQLFQVQISAFARRYLRDLKRAANIQVRDDSKPDALIR